MAPNSGNVDGFITRSSDEQAEDNAERARRPAGAVPVDSSVTLTGHTTEAGVAQDDDGNVVGAHTTTVITDPNDPLAVQVPDPDVHPAANATRANALGVQAEPSPNQVADGEGDPTSTVDESTDADSRSGFSGGNAPDSANAAAEDDPDE